MLKKSKKHILFVNIVSIMLILTCALSFTACHKNKSESNKKIFGTFGYNGNYLTDYATKDISSDEAIEIINKNSYSLDFRNSSRAFATTSSDSYSSEIPTTPDSIANAYADKYASCEITMKYYNEGSYDLQTTVNFIQGYDRRYIISTNSWNAYPQAKVKFIIMYKDLISYMEYQNQLFKRSEQALNAPFKDIFSYYEDARGNLVIQTHEFAEIPSSIKGGISCNFRQDTEILYDADNKISKWQTSLGVYSSTPSGTFRQGYILEMEFKWNIKN